METKQVSPLADSSSPGTLTDSQAVRTHATITYQTNDALDFIVGLKNEQGERTMSTVYESSKQTELRQKKLLKGYRCYIPAP